MSPVKIERTVISKSQRTDRWFERLEKVADVAPLYKHARRGGLEPVTNIVLLQGDKIVLKTEAGGTLEDGTPVILSSGEMDTKEPVTFSTKNLNGDKIITKVSGIE